MTCVLVRRWRFAQRHTHTRRHINGDTYTETQAGRRRQGDAHGETHTGRRTQGDSCRETHTGRCTRGDTHKETHIGRRTQGDSIMFSMVAASVYTHINQCIRFPFSLHTHQHLFSVVCLIITILTDVTWCHCGFDLTIPVG